MTLLWGAAASGARADQQGDLNQVLSRLQAMSQDSHTSAEWAEVLDRLDAVEQQARRDQRWSDLVESRLVHAMVLGDMQRDYPRAIALLEQTRGEFKGQSVPELRKVFIREAEMYGKLGDEQAVNRLMKEFRKSPSFDPQNYPYSGGQGPGVPLAVTRPSVTGAESLSLTAMSVYRKQAQVAPGSIFPAYHLTDSGGRSWTPAELTGKVVLLDFWIADWAVWNRGLAEQRKTYQRFQREGFEILGIGLDKDPAAAAARVGALPWPVIVDGTSLTRSIGLFGEAANFLIDRNGQVIGRDLRGADLHEAVRQALARP